MPLYTYKCTQCDFSDEGVVRMMPVKKRDKKFPCDIEGCTGIMERDVDIPSFHLKGTGWYKQVKEPKKKEEKKE